MQDSTQQEGGKLPVHKFLLGGIALLLVSKIFLASVLDLYSDEVFYWQASANPAIAYSDLPFMTALLIGLGSALDSYNTLAARGLFILVGSSLPLLVYWIAKPVTTSKQAIESAALSLCLPLAGFLGLLAVPDVPLIFFGLLAIGNFERALRTDHLQHWILTGVFVALGLCTHYRFFLYPAAAILFLAFFKAEHRQWKNPRLWLSMLIASLGLIPILWFNLSNQLSSASFYFVDRHPWEFQTSGLLHAFKQAGLVTPGLYILFGYTIFLMFKKARDGDRSAALLLSFALINISVYLLLAPWTDATSTSIHWPLSGYFPLLVYVPFALRCASQLLSTKFSAQTAHRLVLAIPVIGFVGTLTALFGVGSQAFQLQLQPLIGSGVLSNKMAGWKQFSSHVDELLTSEFASSPLLLTDNYYTLAQSEFAGLTSAGFTLDEEKAVRDGRIAQYQIWGKDVAGLERVAADEYLFIAEDSTLDTAAKHELLQGLCARTEQLSHLGELSLFNGDKKFSFYRGSALHATSSPEQVQAAPCPLPSIAWIDSPARGAELSGVFEVNGWAYNEDIGIESISLLVDGIAIAEVNYGGSRPDVVEVMNVQSDPNRPNIGYNYSFDSNQFANGSYQLEIEVRNNLGIRQKYGERRIEVSN
ncbi:MAG: membrane protein [Pseudohongiella sp.]|nr:MAG: membrane protein [Pseudohongiella sp.]